MDKQTLQEKPAYPYKSYLMVFPVELNQKIEPQMRKDFEIDFTTKETATKEIINLTLARDKLTEQLFN